MKKIFVFLIFIFGFITVFAQNNPNKETREIKTDAVQYKSFDKVIEGLRSLGVEGIATNEFMFTDTTVTTAVDTLAKQFGTNYTNLIFSYGYVMVISAKDTIQFSHYIDFPSNRTMTLYPNESYTTQFKIINNVNRYYNGYYKVLGSGTATVRFFLEGF